MPLGRVTSCVITETTVPIIFIFISVIALPRWRLREKGAGEKKRERGDALIDCTFAIRTPPFARTRWHALSCVGGSAKSRRLCKRGPWTTFFFFSVLCTPGREGNSTASDPFFRLLSPNAARICGRACLSLYLVTTRHNYASKSRVSSRVSVACYQGRAKILLEQGSLQ